MLRERELRILHPFLGHVVVEGLVEPVEIHGLLRIARLLVGLAQHAVYAAHLHLAVELAGIPKRLFQLGHRFIEPRELIEHYRLIDERGDNPLELAGLLTHRERHLKVVV